MRLTLLYFSPTHTTRKIVSAVGKVFFEKMLCETRIADVTSLAARQRAYPFGQDDVLIFGAPVSLNDLGRRFDRATLDQATARLDKAIWDLKPAE